MMIRFDKFVERLVFLAGYLPENQVIDLGSGAYCYINEMSNDCTRISFRMYTHHRHHLIRNN